MSDQLYILDVSPKGLRRAYETHDRMARDALVEVFGYQWRRAKREVGSHTKRIHEIGKKYGMPGRQVISLHEDPIYVAARLAGKPELEITREQYAVYHKKVAPPAIDKIDRNRNRLRGSVRLNQPRH